MSTLLQLEKDPKFLSATREETHVPSCNSTGAPGTLLPHERNPKLPASTPEEAQLPRCNWRGTTI